MGSIFQNHALIAGLLAMTLAQILKPFIHYLTYHEWDPVQMFSSGGMPSSHSAFVCALALVTGMRAGFDSEIFAVAAVFGIIVLYDAANVRWQSGLHAQRINQILVSQLEEAIRLIESNRAAMDALVDELVSRNSLNEKEIDRIFSEKIK